MNLSKYSAEAFDRGAPRWKEVLWVICKNLFFLPGWPMPSIVRAILLEMFGARIGVGVVIRSGVNITFPWRFSTGDHVWIGEEVHILCLAQVTLGSHVCVSQRAFLCTGSHDHRTPAFDLITRPIQVGDECWIAATAFVGPGVDIGKGSVVGAGSVVMKSVPRNSFVTGNPAVVRESGRANA